MQASTAVEPDEYILLTQLRDDLLRRRSLTPHAILHSRYPRGLSSEMDRDFPRQTMLSAAHERLADRILVDRVDADLDQLRKLLRRFADDLMR